MAEPSRGYRESNPPSLRLWRTSPSSRDLMARFDMAHDRADRLPEVRAYLENLRPQILKLQRELKLQTQEDIDGLDRRDDLKMNDVDVLVELIKAFSMAWKENRLTRDQVAEMEGVEAFKEARDAFEAYVTYVDAAMKYDVGETIPDNAFFVIRATALAGEPKLAWKWYKRLRDEFSLEDWLSPAISVPTLLAIWKGYQRIGEFPPFLAGEFVSPLNDDGLWVDCTTEGDRKLRETIAAEVAEELCRNRNGADTLAAGNIKNLSDWLETMRVLLKINPNHLDALEGVHTIGDQRLSERPFLIQIQYLMMMGKTREALVLYRMDGIHTGLLGVTAAGLIRAGRTQEALSLLPVWDTVDLGAMYRRVTATGKIVLALLEMNDLETAIRVMPENVQDYGSAFLRRDLPAIVAGLIRLGCDREFVFRLVDIHAKHLPAWPDEELYALRRVIPMLFEHGIDPTPIIMRLYETAETISSKETQTMVNSGLLEIESGIALRTFNRAARLYREPGTSRNADWNREAWEARAAEIIATRPDIANELTYDEPIP